MFIRSLLDVLSFTFTSTPVTMPVLISTVVFCSLFLNLIEPARILAVYPVPSISHQVVFRALTLELVRRGHEVTVITPDPAFPEGPRPANLTEIDIREPAYGVWKKKILNFPKGNKDNLSDQVKMFLDVGYSVTDAVLSNKEIRYLIENKSDQFDLLMLEACLRILLGLSSIFKVPVIQVSSFGASYGNFEAIGAPVNPILYASINRKKNHNLTMWDKIIETYNHYQVARINEEYEKLENILLKKHLGSKTPPLAELANNVDMLFLNVHPVFEGIRPVPPSVVYMGGVHQIPDKELPTELKTLLDSSTNGVIYLSFGTNVDPSLVTEEKLRMFVSVLSQSPYLVLWKWNSEKLPGQTENIRISKWWPQSDLLKHPNVKLFITQGGLQSTDEAITAGVPLIGIPMIGDQWFNVERYVHHKIGVKLDMETLTEAHLRNAIETVIGDSSYRRNMISLRNKMYDQPMQPLERAVWWTEHMLRHGGARHLRSPAANMSWTEYLELELIITVLTMLLVVIFLVFLSVYLLCKSFRRITIKKKIS